MAEIDDLFADNDNDTELVRTLRKALKDKDKEIKDVQGQLAERAKSDRTRSLADLLKEKELPDKIAKLYPETGDVSAEALDTWLSEFGDVFGIQQPGTTADEATVNAAKRIATATAGAPPAHHAVDIEALTAEIAAAKNPAEYKAALAKLNFTK